MNQSRLQVGFGEWSVFTEREPSTAGFGQRGLSLVGILIYAYWFKISATLGNYTLKNAGHVFVCNNYNLRIVKKRRNIKLRLSLGFYVKYINALSV
jgi:hypothetical protein